MCERRTKVWTREDAKDIYQRRDFSILYSDDHVGLQGYLDSSRNLGVYSTFADFVYQIAQPETVLDVGCGRGDLVDALRKKGVEAWGFDASNYIFNDCLACEYLFIFDVLSHLWFFGEKTFDVVCVFEVLEHFIEDDVSIVLDRICSVAMNYIIGTIPDDSDPPDHFCIKPREWWDENFARRGFESMFVGDSLSSLDPYFHPYCYKCMR